MLRLIFHFLNWIFFPFNFSLVFLLEETVDYFIHYTQEILHCQCFRGTILFKQSLSSGFFHQLIHRIGITWHSSTMLPALMTRTSLLSAKSWTRKCRFHSHKRLFNEVKSHFWDLI